VWSSAAVAHLLQGSACCALRDGILHTLVGTTTNSRGFPAGWHDNQPVNVLPASRPGALDICWHFSAVYCQGERLFVSP